MISINAHDVQAFVTCAAAVWVVATFIYIRRLRTHRAD